MAFSKNANRHAADVTILLRDIVNRETGIFFEERWLKVFMEKIHPLVEARGGSLIDFYYTLKYDDSGDAWSEVFNALSVQETYFWREINQINALVEKVVPQWFAQSRRPLRIWSAACASGEEPLSIAMALLEAGWGGYPIEIVASDASQSALDKAERGIYRDRAFRALPVALKNRHFSQAEKGWQVSPELKKRVTYRRANLVSRAEVLPCANAEVIFCRNVFIYFSRETIQRTAAFFAEAMPDNGKLFVGVSESLVNLTDDFVLDEIDEAFVYVRKESATR